MTSETIDIATIVNQALVGIGMPASFAIDDQTTFGSTCRLAYGQCRDRVFGLHNWSFLRRTRKLVRHSATPDNGWTYGFDMPGDRLGAPLEVLRSLNPRTRLRDYDIEGASLYAEYSDIWMRIKLDLDPEYWDPAFRAAFVTALGGYLAVPLQQDLDVERLRLTEAFGDRREGGGGGMFGRLMAQDMAGEPLESPFSRGDPLTDARWS